MSELLDLTVAQASSAIEAGELSGDEYLAAYARAASGDDLNAFLWTCDAASEAGTTADGGPLRGVPIAVKDLFCTEDVPTTAGSRILEGYRPP